MEGRRTLEEIKNDVDAVINERLSDTELNAKNRSELTNLYNNQQFKMALANRVDSGQPTDENTSKNQITTTLLTIESAKNAEALEEIGLFTVDQNDRKSQGDNRVKFYYTESRQKALVEENAAAPAAAPAAEAEPKPAPTAPLVRSTSSGDLRKTRTEPLPSPQPTPGAAPAAPVDTQNFDAALAQFRGAGNRPDLVYLLNAHKHSVAEELSKLGDDDEAKQKASDLAITLINASDKEELTTSLTSLGIDPAAVDIDTMNSILKKNRDDRLDRLNAALPRVENIDVDGKELPLSSRKAQREYKKQHPGFLLKKSFEEEVALLDKNKTLINILAKRAEESVYTANQEKTKTEIEKLSRTVLEKQAQLTQLKASCEIRQSGSDSTSDINKFKKIIDRIDLLLGTLEDTQASIALTRTLANEAQTSTVFAGTEARQFENQNDAYAFIQEITGISKVGGLSEGISTKTKALLTEATKFDAIKRITTVGNYQMVTGSVQTVKNPGTPNESFHQEIYADPQLMKSRHGLRPNNLPADHTMEWAIDEVNNFVNLTKNSGKPIHITAGSMHKYQVEALMIVCAAKNLTYNLSDGDPVKISDKDLEKRVEKAKKHPTYGLKLQSTEELANTSSSLRRKR